MAFVVEDVSLVLLANSYADVAAADLYFLDRGIEDWDSLGTDEKEDALVRGTSYLDTVYRLRWKGFKRLQDQAVNWPRTDVHDEDGFSIPDDQMPKVLLNATFEMALALVDITTAVPKGAFAVDRDLAPLSSLEETVDVISVKKTFMDLSQAGGSALSGQSSVRFEAAKTWISGLIVSAINNRVERG